MMSERLKRDEFLAKELVFLAKIYVGERDLLTQNWLDDIYLNGLVSFAERHGLGPLLSATILAQTSLQLSYYESISRADTIHLNKVRNQGKGDWIDRMLDQFNRRGIPAVLRKGLLYEKNFYYGSGHRVVGDLDFFIDIEHREECAQLLNELGFAPGQYCRRTGRFLPITREEELLYSIYPDHMPPYSIVLGDPILPAISIDICHKLLWKTAPESDAICDISRRYMNGFSCNPWQAQNIDSLRFHLADCSLHIYREMRIRKRAGHPRMQLSRFVDLFLIYISVTSEADRAGVDILSGIEPQIKEMINWTLTHLGTIFELESNRELEIQSMPAQSFNSWIDENGAVQDWGGSIFEKIAEFR